MLGLFQRLPRVVQGVIACAVVAGYLWVAAPPPVI
jgi:hypothetical protein